MRVLVERAILERAIEALELEATTPGLDTTNEAIAALRAALAAEPAQSVAQANNEYLRAHLVNLLARIHRDGGHYLEEHGLEKAVADADQKVAVLNSELPAPVPLNPKEIKDILRSTGYVTNGQAWEISDLLVGRVFAPAPVPVPQAEPYGHVTTHTVTGQQFFYRYPQPPYLDTAKECIAVYAAPPAQPAPVLVPPGWMPIETAPKDGRKIILFYRNRNDKARTVMASWVTDEEAAETDEDGVGLTAGWYEAIDNWDDYTAVAIHEGEPTHWMPLPPPPGTQPGDKP